MTNIRNSLLIAGALIALVPAWGGIIWAANALLVHELPKCGNENACEARLSAAAKKRDFEDRVKELQVSLRSPRQG